MAFLFNKNKQRGNLELCRSTKDTLQKLEAGEKLSPRVEEELARNISSMKVVLQGTAGAANKPSTPLIS